MLSQSLAGYCLIACTALILYYVSLLGQISSPLCLNFNSRSYQVVARVKTALYGPLSKIPGPAIGRWTNLVVKYHTLSGRRMQYIDSLFTQYGEELLH